MITYWVIDSVAWLSEAADRVGANRVAARLHAVWRRMGLAWHPESFEVLR